MSGNASNALAQATARVYAGDVQYEVYKIQTGNADTVLEIFGHLKVTSALLYVNGGLASDGTPNQISSQGIYIGRRRGFLLDFRAQGEESVPYVIGETVRSELQEARMYVIGSVGDTFVLIYRTT